MSVTENLKQVEARVQAACDRSGRNRDDVTLIAVSKTKPVSMIEEAVSAGMREFGENKPQEIRDKYDCLPDSLHWHMIGHLQRNKIKYIIDKCCMIHSIESVRLAEAVSEEAVKHQLIMPVLVEVNIAGEESKYGLHAEETESFIRQIAKLPGIHVSGLMCIAPYTEDSETNRPYFRALRNLSIDIAKQNIDNVTMRHLSMGMSGDFETAVEEGATLIRVGTGIFGARQYNL